MSLAEISKKRKAELTETHPAVVAGVVFAWWWRSGGERYVSARSLFEKRISKNDYGDQFGGKRKK